MSKLRLIPALVAGAAAGLLGACVVAPPVVRVAPPAAAVAVQTPPAVVSVYVDPPLVQPAPVAVEFAPPPMLVQVPPPPPSPDWVWIGGYWGWQGRWVWCSGRWAPPPGPGYVWNHPYYENRDGAVIFVAGFWRAPTVAFVPPPPTRLAISVSLAGVTGVRPIGPPGVFVPPPPGSRPGIVVPAPIGTPPAVVTGAPPVVNVGMRVQANTSIDSHDVTRINQTTINNVTNVTIVAPPGATASGKAFQATAPAQAHLAAALPAAVHLPAPPATAPLPTHGAAHAPPALAPAARPMPPTGHADPERAEPQHAQPLRAAMPPEHRPAAHERQAAEKEAAERRKERPPAEER